MLWYDLPCLKNPLNFPSKFYCTDSLGCTIYGGMVFTNVFGHLYYIFPSKKVITMHLISFLMSKNVLWCPLTELTSQKVYKFESLRNDLFNGISLLKYVQPLWSYRCLFTKIFEHPHHFISRDWGKRVEQKNSNWCQIQKA